MRCPYCGADESKVIDSRPTEDGEKMTTIPSAAADFAMIAENALPPMRSWKLCP